MEPNHYEFVSAVWGKNEYGEDVKIPPADADISFRRVGVNAGKIDTVLDDKSTQSHYFIKFSGNIFNTTLFNTLSKIKFNTSDDTVGAKSISKPELDHSTNCRSKLPNITASIVFSSFDSFSIPLIYKLTIK